MATVGELLMGDRNRKNPGGLPITTGWWPQMQVWLCLLPPLSSSASLAATNPSRLGPHGLLSSWAGAPSTSLDRQLHLDQGARKLGPSSAAPAVDTGPAPQSLRPCYLSTVLGL